MNKHVIALRVLRDHDEQVVDGAVWLKCLDLRQFKVSPKGLQGDYDTGAFWVDFDALEEHFGSSVRGCTICGTTVYGPSGSDNYVVHIGCKNAEDRERSIRADERAKIAADLRAEANRLNDTDPLDFGDEIDYQCARAQIRALRDAADRIEAP